jgi:hypothetical protein
MGREGRIDKVNHYDLVAAISKSPDKPLTEVAGASRNEDTHKREITFLLPNDNWADPHNPASPPAITLRARSRRLEQPTVGTR